jgi:hypothetical protein
MKKKNSKLKFYVCAFFGDQCVKCHDILQPCRGRKTIWRTYTGYRDFFGLVPLDINKKGNKK